MAHGLEVSVRGGLAAGRNVIGKAVVAAGKQSTAVEGGEAGRRGTGRKRETHAHKERQRLGPTS